MTRSYMRRKMKVLIWLSVLLLLLLKLSLSVEKKYVFLLFQLPSLTSLMLVIFLCRLVPQRSMFASTATRKKNLPPPLPLLRSRRRLESVTIFGTFLKRTWIVVVPEMRQLLVLALIGKMLVQLVVLLVISLIWKILLLRTQSIM